MKVLILGARAPACLEWARAFCEYGAQVWVADSQTFPLSRFSKSVGRYVLLPEPKDNPDLWAKCLKNFIKQESIDLVIPTCEEVFYLSAAMEFMDFGCKLLTSSFSLLHKLHHKGTFAQVVAGLSTSTPQTRIIYNQSELLEFAHVSSNWVFKPAYSRFAVQTLIKPSEKALKSIVPSTCSPWVAQEYIAGKEYCSFSVLSGGKLQAHACYHPRYRVGKGSGIYFEVANPPEVLRFVQDFGARTGYTGQVGFDFIAGVNAHFFVLECNPRATSGVHLFDDQRKLLVDALFANDSTSLLIPSEKSRMVGLAMVLFAMTKHGISNQFWKDFCAARDVICGKGDPGPLWGQIPGAIEILAKALSRRCNLLSAATADIEWDGQSIFSTGDNTQ